MLAVLARRGWRELAEADRRRVTADPAAAGLRPPLPPARGRRLRSADGTELHVEVRGPEHAPTVVLAHAWACSAALWAPQVAALSGAYRVVTYDQRGHGRSGAPRGGDYSAEALADDLATVLSGAVPAGSRALLAGHSMGAMSIVAWAGRYPEQVADRAAAALLVSTGVDGLLGQAAVLALPVRWRRLRALSGRLMLTAPMALGRPSPVSHRALRHIALSPGASPATVRLCEDLVLGCPTAVRVGCGATLADLDLRDGVPRLRVPTSVLVGTADRLTPPGHARRLAAALPRLEQLVEVPGAGHMTPVESPAEVTAALRHLAERHLAARSVPDAQEVPA
jgi:pimeloyl-ACP methyl ester carboxylesterase